MRVSLSEVIWNFYFCFYSLYQMLLFTFCSEIVDKHHSDNDINALVKAVRIVIIPTLYPDSLDDIQNAGEGPANGTDEQCLDKFAGPGEDFDRHFSARGV